MIVCDCGEVLEDEDALFDHMYTPVDMYGDEDE